MFASKCTNATSDGVPRQIFISEAEAPSLKVAGDSTELVRAAYRKGRAGLPVRIWCATSDVVQTTRRPRLLTGAFIKERVTRIELAL
ncbi:hypothetical protein [Streptomyces sp. NBC_01508]|uniref:hypothetical protein n=1 Tax=Streptomyces sp. NBC_01508 TaxID=2903888 RepID=UPI0038640F56